MREETEREIFPELVHFQAATIARYCKVKVRNQKLDLTIPHGSQGPKHLIHHLLPKRHIQRELGQNWSSQDLNQISDMRYQH